MAPRRARGHSVATAAVSVLGVVDGARVIEFLASWSLTMEARGWEPISLEDWATHWNVSRASAFRRQALFRRAFPALDLPNDLVLAMKAQLEESGNQEPEATQIAGAALAARPQFV